MQGDGNIFPSPHKQRCRLGEHDIVLQPRRTIGLQNLFYSSRPACIGKCSGHLARQNAETSFPRYVPNETSCFHNESNTVVSALSFFGMFERGCKERSCRAYAQGKLLSLYDVLLLTYCTTIILCSQARISFPFWYYSNMFQDIGVGILLSILTSYLFNIALTPLLLFLCIIFALLPDIDLILPKKLVRGHRGFVHYPIFYIIISVFVYFTFGPMWCFVFFVATIYHLLHDTLFLGWGIKWFWPISSRSIKFFPDRAGRITSQVLLSWLPSEEAEVKIKYASPHWIRDFHFRPSIVSVSEYSIFIISIVTLYFYTR